MRTGKAMRTFAGLLCLQLAFSQLGWSAEPQSVPLLTDVRLHDGGLLTGQVVDGAGVPSADATVTVAFGNQPVAETQTDSKGEFQVRGLRGGVHAVALESGVAQCRLWAPGTAPPKAGPRVLLVENQEVVRGKSCAQHKFAHALSNPWLLMGVAAVAIAVPVALNGGESESGS